MGTDIFEKIDVHLQNHRMGTWTGTFRVPAGWAIVFSSCPTTRATETSTRARQTVKIYAVTAITRITTLAI